MPTNSKFNKFLWSLCSVLLLVFCLMGSTAIAQQCDLLGAKEGDKALSFSFNGFNIDKFHGGVGGKYWISNKSALFGSMDFSLDYSKNDNLTSKSTDISFMIGLEKHLYACSRISPYWGFNGSIGYQHGIKMDSESNIKQEKNYTYFSSGMMFGIEYWILKNISLAGQYGSYAKYSIREEIMGSNDSYRIKEKETGFSVGFDTASLTLSIYF